MPKTTNEDDKKHGDKLESLIERMGSSTSPGKRSEGTDDDATAARQDDEDEDNEDEDDEDVDEDIQPDDVEDRDSVGR